MADADAVKKVCEIYDWDGKGQLDMIYLMDVVYALGYNVTKKVCVGLGQQEEEKKKYASFDDVVKLVNEAIKAPESSGTYHDYVELCKLYDKNENGTMMLAELENVLSNLADEIPKEDTMDLLKELADPEDEEGFFPYAPFLDRLTGRPKLSARQNQKKKEKRKRCKECFERHPFKIVFGIVYHIEFKSTTSEPFGYYYYY